VREVTGAEEGGRDRRWREILAVTAGTVRAR
jgi:hypothetical protein